MSNSKNNVVKGKHATSVDKAIYLLAYDFDYSLIEAKESSKFLWSGVYSPTDYKNAITSCVMPDNLTICKTVQRVMRVWCFFALPICMLFSIPLRYAKHLLCKNKILLSLTPLQLQQKYTNIGAFMVRYGYACKTIGVPETEQRSCTLSKATQTHLLEITHHNIRVLEKAVSYCKSKKIPLLRISSDVVPLASHPQIQFDWQRLCRQELHHLGEAINTAKLRVSMHPGQYTVLNSPRKEVVQQAVQDLIFHADFLDAINMDTSGRIILHVGGLYGNRAEALERFINNYKTLPSHVTARLALENDEHCFNINDVTELCTSLQLPVIFDVLHHAINPAQVTDISHWLDITAKTWASNTGRHKVHYSQQLEGAKAGMHSHTIKIQPFMEFHNSLQGRDIDVMLEVKDKNLSAVKCQHLTTANLPHKALTEACAQYKNAVMERGQKYYQEIKNYMSLDYQDAYGFYQRLEAALLADIPAGAALNAAQHVWGYLSEHVEEKDKKSILNTLQPEHFDLNKLHVLKNKLLSLAKRHNKEYLINSLYFYIT